MESENNHYAILMELLLNYYERYIFFEFENDLISYPLYLHHGAKI